MAELNQSTRQQTTTFIIIGLLVVLVIGVAALFISPSSPLRPQASELANSGSPIGKATFRDGTVSRVSGDKVSVDEPNGGSFTFSLTEEIAIRTLNADNKFEITERTKLGSGDTVSVFYQETDSGLILSRVDILQDK